MNERFLKALKTLKEEIDKNKKAINNLENQNIDSINEQLKLIADSIKKYEIKNGYWYFNDENIGIRAEGYDGKDGKPGKDGYTPVKGKDYFDGAPGKDGYTPVKGKDYFDGAPGKDGKDGVTPILKIGKVETSPEYGGALAKLRKGKDDIIYLDLTLPRGPQGFPGFDGKPGKDATINGINTLNIVAGDNITIDQEDDTLTINSTGGEVITDYEDLENLPEVNNVVLKGNLSSSDLGLQPSTDNTLETVHKTIPTAINEVNSVAKGAGQAVGYNNYQTMITALNSLSSSTYKVGQNIYIVTLEVPDLWVSSVESSSSTYTYTTDDDFIDALDTDGYVQVGYYKLSMLETQKVDLTNYIKNTDYATSQKGGVIKTDTSFGTYVTSDGKLRAEEKTYSQYQNLSNYLMISKGTLENVITGKHLINQTTLDDSQSIQDEHIDRVETLSNLFDDKTGTGTELSINDTQDTILKLGLSGNTYQDGEPTPESPVDIEVVTGDNEITVGNKNLCNIIDLTPSYYSSGIPSGSSNQIAVDSFNSNNITFHSTSANYNMVLSNVIQLKPNTQYTIKFNRTTTSTNNQWFVYDYNNENYTINYRDNNQGITQTTFTTNSLGQIALAFGHGNTTGNTTISNIQIEQGSTATDYIEHKEQVYPINLGNIEMCEIGDYKDSFIETDGTWYKHAEIGKCIFNSNTNWKPVNDDENSRTQGLFTTFYLRDIKSYAGSYQITPDILINKYIAYPNYYFASPGRNPVDKSMSTIQGNIVYVQNSDFSGYTNEQVKTAMIGTIFYYPLASPTNTELTDTTLISQLNAIKYAMAYNDQTNISQINDEQPFIIDYETYKKVPTKVSELTNDAGYVKDTDYATNSVGGTIKSGNNMWVTPSTGVVYGGILSYSDYQDVGGANFISKGTLENVITGKGLVDDSKIKTTTDTTQGDVYDVTYINAMIGDIETILTRLTTGSGV